MEKGKELTLLYHKHRDFPLYSGRDWAWSSSQRDIVLLKGLACLQPYKISTGLNNTINTTQLTPRMFLKTAVHARLLMW